MSRIILSFGILFIVTAFCSVPASAGSSCKTVIIQTKDKVRSTKIDLYEMAGGVIKKVPGATIEKKDANFPLTMMDCGDNEHYFIQRNGTAYLIKQAIFKCIAVKSSASLGIKGSYAGAPGSGKTNTKC